MKGDFSRLTFDRSKQFSRVLMQQGRVQVDADWNEQSDIVLHYLRALAADLIGPFGGPAKDDITPGDGFKIEMILEKGELSDLKIGKGRYYVDGILSENLGDGARFLAQPNLPLEKELPHESFLIYLDVWERHITHIEDGSIREVALGGPDTATRAQVIWQVRATEKRPEGDPNRPDPPWPTSEEWEAWVKLRLGGGLLKARAKLGTDVTDPCVASPDARFRGPENQLYRVEIHKKGTAGGGATFKWSRDNGSVTFPILNLATDSGANTTTVTLENLGQDGRLTLSAEDWVEIVDDSVALRYDDEPLPLLQVASVDSGRSRVTLRKTIGSTVGQNRDLHPLLRRWDQGRSKGPKPGTDGDLKVVEGADQWLDLEEGVQVSFQPAPAGSPAFSYRRGDYWLIPARTATGDVEWPGPPENPQALPPQGVEHRFAPLGVLLDPTASTRDLRDLRSQFVPLGKLV
ncbi:MAG TPA: DUF6519 domain-containing protein [Thermoanaerobaculia bacterium]|nr:DUF6519 domain-containing protein [Thermoanaerobaculia bacterium]